MSITTGKIEYPITKGDNQLCVDPTGCSDDCGSLFDYCDCGGILIVGVAIVFHVTLVIIANIVENNHIISV